jgi:hypothetical protein
MAPDRVRVADEVVGFVMWCVDSTDVGYWICGLITDRRHQRVNGCNRQIAVDTGGLLLAVIVTMAGLQDRDAADRLLARLRECSPQSSWSGTMPDTPGRLPSAATSCT